MASRITHLISSECDVTVEQLGKGHVRIRITERDRDIANPTDFEIEGNPFYIAEALVTIGAVLARMDDLTQQEPN